MENLKALRNNLNLGDYGEDFIMDYSESNYYSDAISEFADSNTSIYYSDIMKFISEHPYDVDDAIKEFGWDGCGGELYKAGQMAEYRLIQNNIYECYEDILLAITYDYLINIGHEEIDDSILEDIESQIDSNIDRYDVIVDICNDALEEEEE